MYDISDERFDELITRAMNELPQDYITGLNNVVITMADEPSAEQIEKMKLREGTVLLGLYEGVPLTQRGSGWSGMLPDKITLFKHSILRVVQSDGELFEQIKRTLWHEIAHYYGLSHADMEQRMATVPVDRQVNDSPRAKRQAIMLLVIAAVVSAGLIAAAYWLDNRYSLSKHQLAQPTTLTPSVAETKPSTTAERATNKTDTAVTSLSTAAAGSSSAQTESAIKTPAKSSPQASPQPTSTEGVSIPSSPLLSERQRIEQRDGCKANEPACSVSIATAIERLQRAGYTIHKQTALHYDQTQRIQSAYQLDVSGDGVSGIVVDLYSFYDKADMWYALEHPVGNEFDNNGFGLYGTPALYVSVHAVPGIQSGTAADRKVSDGILHAITNGS